MCSRTGECPRALCRKIASSCAAPHITSHARVADSLPDDVRAVPLMDDGDMQRRRSRTATVFYACGHRSESPDMSDAFQHAAVAAVACHNASFRSPSLRSCALITASRRLPRPAAPQDGVVRVALPCLGTRTAGNKRSLMKRGMAVFEFGSSILPPGCCLLTPGSRTLTCAHFGVRLLSFTKFCCLDRHHQCCRKEQRAMLQLGAENGPMSARVGTFAMGSLVAECVVVVGNCLATVSHVVSGTWPGLAEHFAFFGVP